MPYDGTIADNVKNLAALPCSSIPAKNGNTASVLTLLAASSKFFLANRSTNFSVRASSIAQHE